MSEILWRALYDDGTFLHQRGPNNEKHGYHDIDRVRLAAFDLVQGDNIILRVDMRNPVHANGVGSKRLIWRVRNELKSTGEQVRVHMAGWQRKVNGSNVQAICYVGEDGTVLLGGQWGEDQFFYPVKPLECEADLRADM